MTAHPKIYFVPGLGADRRLFMELRNEGLHFEVLEFIPHLKGESLRDYAHRLAAGIDASQPHILGGVSLGGMMATEIARITQPEKLILISTVKNSREFPFYLKTFRYLPLYRLVSGRFLVRHAPRERRKNLLPAHADALDGMREDADPEFVKWAIGAVLNWRRGGQPEHAVHIHGTKDRLFPGWHMGERVRIKGGSHVMVLTHAAEIVAKIRAHLASTGM
ncbi:MAG: alpha/beta hydrolase [Bacteroidota bacterium]